MSLPKFLFKKLIPHPRWAVISIPYIWMLVFFAIPFLIVLKISFSSQAIAIPPYYGAAGVRRQSTDGEIEPRQLHRAVQ